MQTLFNVKPGDHAIIVNSVNGPKGPSVGRRVFVHKDAPRSDADVQYVKDKLEQGIELPASKYDLPHREHGKIWPVTCLDNGLFTDEYGQSRDFAEVPDKWLQKIEPPPPIAKDTTKEKEIA